MATINKTILNREVKKLLFNKDIQDLAYQRASREFERIKKQALAEFDKHPVTQEINGGIQAKNISNTLPGTKGDANLFSFIGKFLIEEDRSIDRSSSAIDRLKKV